jgi:hypothetical protein
VVGNLLPSAIRANNTGCSRKPRNIHSNLHLATKPSLLESKGRQPNYKHIGHKSSQVTGLAYDYAIQYTKYITLSPL